MKKILFILVLTAYFCSWNAFGQEAPVPRLKVFADEKAAQSAKEKSDADIEDAKKNVKAATWVNRGDVYGGVAADAKLTSDEAYAKALEAYGKALELDPGNKNATKGLGELYISCMKTVAATYKDDTESALKAATLASKINPKDTTAFLYAGQFAFQMENYDLYAQNLEKVLENGVKSNRDNLYARLATYYLTKSDFNKTEEILKKGFDEFPKSNDLSLTQIELYIRTNKLEEATQKLEAAVAAAPDNADLLYNLALVYDKGDKIDLAVATYEKCLAIRPDYKVALYNLGAMYNNRAKKLRDEVNNMDDKMYKAEGEKKTVESKSNFEKALPHFEKLYKMELDKGFKESVQRALLSVYSGLKMTDDYERISKEIGDN